MSVENVHFRDYTASPAEVGVLIDSLASAGDRLWPWDQWPRIQLDRPLRVGASGGHGPIRYFVEEYEPAVRVRFRFTAPAGFLGYHEFRVAATDAGQTRLTHAIVMRLAGVAWVAWPLLFRPLHDALLEDALDKAERELGGHGQPRPWSWWVVCLRWLLRRGRRRAASK